MPATRTASTNRHSEPDACGETQTKRKNQHKPCPPEAIVLPIVQKYWSCGVNDKKILEFVHAEIDHSKYGMSLKSLKLFRKAHNMLSTRQQKHTLDSITESVAEVRERFPEIGAAGIVKTLRTEQDQHVPRDLVLGYLHTTEPVAVKRRRANRFTRRRFWATGVNEVWGFDQHDKWLRFGLWFHIGVEFYSGKILWLRVWWTNKQPRLIASYYFDTVREFGFVPLLTQSDPGRENNGIANAHTLLRRHYDPSLNGTIQHRWKSKKKGMNIKPEIKWSVFRREFTPGFETLFEQGLQMGWYHPQDPLHELAFRWLAIPWIQAQADTYRHRSNSSCPRADKKKILPHGIPDIIFERPEHFPGSVDYKVSVEPEIIAQVSGLYAPPEHDVFELVPSWFSGPINAAYQAIGSPVLCMANFWQIFKDVFMLLREDMPIDLQTHLRTVHITAQLAEQAVDDIQLIDGEPAVRLSELAANAEGGERNSGGSGLHIEQLDVPYVDFSDESGEDDDEEAEDDV